MATADIIGGDPPYSRSRRPVPPRVRRVVRRAFLGFWVDYYDIYLPIVALAPAMAYFQPDYLPSEVQLTLFYLSFAVTLVARPIGAILFGYFADSIGRRRMTLVSMYGFGAATLLIACLPGYDTIGIVSFILFISLRFLDGIFLGGEYTAANPLAMEAAPKERRGFLGSLVAVAYPTAYVGISVVTAAVLFFVPAGSREAPYAQWAWRIPFVIGGLLALLIAVSFRNVEESAVWEKAKEAEPEKSPLKDLFRGQNLRSLAQVFLLMTGLWFIVQALISAAPGLFVGTLGQPDQAVTNAILVCNVALAAGFVASGVLSQWLGRRPYFMAVGVLTATVAAPAYYGALVMLDRSGSFFTGMVLYGLALVISGSCFGVILTYINERFPTGVRASGYGIGYSVAIIIPSFYGVYMLGLGQLIPYRFTPVPLVVLAGILMLVGAWLGPETRDVDLAQS